MDEKQKNIYMKLRDKKIEIHRSINYVVYIMQMYFVDECHNKNQLNVNNLKSIQRRK